jgi:transcriptional regulator with XRE-family HTH domain
VGEFYTSEDWFAERENELDIGEGRNEHKLSYQLARLRLIRGLTQKELAKRIGTKQSSISRLESGKQKPRIGFLEKVVDALDGVMLLDIYPREEYEEYLRSVSHTEEETGASEVPIQIPDWPTPMFDQLQVSDSANIL